MPRREQQERVDVVAPARAARPSAGRPPGSPVTGGERAEHGSRARPTSRPRDGRGHRLVGRPQAVRRAGPTPRRGRPAARRTRRCPAAAASTGAPVVRSQIDPAVARAEAVRRLPERPPRPSGPAAAATCTRHRARAPCGGARRRRYRPAAARAARAAPPGAPASATRPAARARRPAHTDPPSTARDRRRPCRPAAPARRRRRGAVRRPVHARHPAAGTAAAEAPAAGLWMARRRVVDNRRAGPGCGRRPGVASAAYAGRRTSINRGDFARPRTPSDSGPGPACGTVPGRSRDPGRSARRRHVARGSGLRRGARAVPPTGAPRQPCARPGRAAPDREVNTGHGRRHHEAAARQRRALRAPDQALEPEDEALHPHRAQRHLHHRPAADAVLHRPGLRVRQGDRRARRHRSCSSAPRSRRRRPSPTRPAGSTCRT